MKKGLFLRCEKQRFSAPKIDPQNPVKSTLKSPIRSIPDLQFSTLKFC